MHTLYYKHGQEFMTGELTATKSEPTIIILLQKTFLKKKKHTIGLLAYENNDQYHQSSGKCKLKWQQIITSYL